MGLSLPTDRSLACPPDWNEEWHDHAGIHAVSLRRAARLDAGLSEVRASVYPYTGARNAGHSFACEFVCGPTQSARAREPPALQRPEPARSPRAYLRKSQRPGPRARLFR